MAEEETDGGGGCHGAGGEPDPPPGNRRIRCVPHLGPGTPSCSACSRHSPRAGSTTTSSMSGCAPLSPPRGPARTWTSSPPTCRPCPPAPPPAAQYGRHSQYHPASTGPAALARRPGRWALAYKKLRSSAAVRWRVPERFTSVVYKGEGWIDLRAAELTAPVTTVLAVAYIADRHPGPAGRPVEMEGFGWSARAGPRGGGTGDHAAARTRPRCHVRGIAYKGTIEARTRPPEVGPGSGSAPVVR